MATNSSHSPSVLPTSSILLKSKIAFENARKERKRLENFYDCVCFPYIMSRIFGLLPFTIKKDTKGHMESVCVSIFDAVWFVGAISVNLTLAYLIICSLHGSSQFSSAILPIGGRIILVVGLLNAPLSITLDLLNRRRLLKIANEFFAFDKEVKLNYNRFLYVF